MILFLPPAPHTGAFFDNIRQELSDLATKAATYPGYGDVPAIPSASIENYTRALLPQPRGSHLIGFHTGCLVALEMARQQPEIGTLTLVDIPYFDEVTKAKHRSSLDLNDPTHAAFFAAFDYDLTRALQQCRHNVNIIATDSSLHEATVQAANLIKSANLILAKDICKPAFENPEIANYLRPLLVDNSQIKHAGRT